MSHGSMSAPGTNYLYKSMIYGCLGIFAHIFAHNVIRPTNWRGALNIETSITGRFCFDFG
jgi:hypothetical protein